MIRSYKYRLKPSTEQAEVLHRWLARCCDLYNGALQQRIEAFAKLGKSPSRYDQQKDLTQLREDPEWSAVPLLVLRSPLHKIKRSFHNFFRRVKTGDKPGFPRFKPKQRYKSFSIGKVRTEGNYIKVPKLGFVRFNKYREMGEVKDAIIKFDGKKWWVIFQCDVGESPAKINPKSYVGIDLGLNSYAHLSNGKTVENPRYYRKTEEKLQKAQRRLSFKRKGTKSYRKMKSVIAKHWSKIKNQRIDFSRKLAKGLYRRYDLISVEDLSINNMVSSNTGLNKSISDAAWSSFTQALACKAEEAGKHLIKVNPKNTSKECYKCGDINKKSLSDRTHNCSCGYVVDRDLNAALNIEWRGLRQAGLIPSGAYL